MGKYPQATENLAKSATGVKGFDEIGNGGLPDGRPTLIAGGAGSGKTLVGMEFLFRGAAEFGEPGVFFSFEEAAQDLINNFKIIRLGAEKIAAGTKINTEVYSY